MKTILMTTGLILVLSSCECFKIKDDVRRVWSFKFNQCRCQNYSFKKAKELDALVPCEDFYEKERQKNEKKCSESKSFASKNPEKCYALPNADYCDDLMGFAKESWGSNITPHARETIACFEDNQKNKIKCMTSKGISNDQSKGLPSSDSMGRSKEVDTVRQQQ